MPRAMIIGAALLVVVTGCIWACFGLPAQGEETRHFKYTGSVSVDLRDNEDFFVVELAPEVLDTINPTLHDFRLYARDKEFGYLLLPFEELEESTIATEEQPLSLINKGTIGTEKYAFTMVIPEAARVKPVKPVEIVVCLGTTEYLVKAHLYGSNDNRSWQHVAEQTLYGINGTYSSFAIEKIDYDYIKVEYDMPKGEVLSVSSAHYTFSRTVVKEEKIPGTPVDFRTEGSGSQQSLLVDLKYKNHFSKGIILETPERNFHRMVSVEGSNDGKDWAPIIQTYIYQGISSTDSKLGIEYSPEGYRYLRVSVHNKDNPLLKISRMQVQILPLRLLVKATGVPERFDLHAYWGNAKLPPPEYDIAELRPSMKAKDYKQFRLAGCALNSGYVDPTPVTERSPWLMPLSLAALAVLVGLILYRTVKQVKTGGEM